jgi:RNA polymerase sigma-70 factor (ECF subfamily)
LRDPVVSEAFQKVIVQKIARCQTRRRAFVRCLLVRSDDVDDVLQDINAVLWEKADEFKPGTDFWAWASQIAETVGRSAGAVRQTLYRIRALLLECIQRRLSSEGGAS